MIDNNDNAYTIWEMEHESRLRRRPVCCRCENYIQDEVGYCINGNWYCDECLKDEFAHDMEIEFDED